MLLASREDNHQGRTVARGARSAISRLGSSFSYPYTIPPLLLNSRLSQMVLFFVRRSTWPH